MLLLTARGVEHRPIFFWGGGGGGGTFSGILKFRDTKEPFPAFQFRGNFSFNKTAFCDLLSLQCNTLEAKKLLGLIMVDGLLQNSMRVNLYSVLYIFVQ